jgi:CelD/BcsL family acetyltransferase involved in cellulose biosynthesis
MTREFRIVRGKQESEKLGGAWNALIAECQQVNFVHMHQWYLAYLECLETQPDSAMLVLAFNRQKLEAIFPLRVRVETRFGFKFKLLELPHHPHINFQEVILAHDVDHENLVDELIGFLRADAHTGCHAIRFGNVLEMSPTLNMLEKDTSARKTIFPTTHCDLIPVMSADDVRQGVSRNLRGNLRKARHKLANFDDVRFRSTRHPDALEQAFTRFLEVEASGWKGKDGTGSAISLDSRIADFYQQLVDRFGERGNCEINLLEVDGQAVAGQFALIVADIMYLLKIGYNEEYSQIAPGNLLLEHTLDRLNSEGLIREVNLVTGVAWHSSWRPTRRTVYRCYCYSASLPGRLLYAIQKFRNRQALRSKARTG